MKTCPICGARAFDDAEVCYGCLHRYEGTEVGAGTEGKGHQRSVADSRAVTPSCAASPSASPCASAPSCDGGWVVRFELPGYEPVVDANGREGLVVRFRPEAPSGPEERRRAVVARGTHARDAPAPRTAMTERS